VTPEAKARINIDKMLIDAGYVLQDMKEFDRTASLGVAVREFPTQSGPVDYLLLLTEHQLALWKPRQRIKASRSAWLQNSQRVI
jgi:hypothetical protein